MSYVRTSVSLLVLLLFTNMSGLAQDLTPHLDGAFLSANYTWAGDDESNVSVVYYYNDDNAPTGTPVTSIIKSRVSTAFSTWNDATSHDRIIFSAGSPFGTTEGQVQNLVNVISWGIVQAGTAEVKHYPYLQGGAGFGYETLEAADIVVNKNHQFLYEAPETRTQAAADFVETLMHELGHVHGMHHSTQNTQVMYVPYYNRSPSLPIQTLGQGDKAGAFYHHPKAELSGSLPSFPLVMTAREDPIAVTGDLTIFGPLEIEDGMLSNEATITISSSDAHVHLMSGTSITGGAIVIRNGGALTVEGGLLSEGSIDVESGGTLIVENGGKVYGKDISVDAGGLLTILPGADLRFDASEGIMSQGKLEIDGGTFQNTAVADGTTFTSMEAELTTHTSRTLQ